MPRVSRFAVEFTVPSDPEHIYLAEFSHRHCSQVCPHTPKHQETHCRHFDGKGRVKHQVGQCPHPKTILTCPTPRMLGVSYTIERGTDAGKIITVQHLTTVKLRYKGQSTFVTGHAPCSFGDVYNWRQGLHYALQRALEKAGHCRLEKVAGRVRVVKKKPIYNEIMRMFWREMRVKGPAAVALPASVIPLQNQHGLGYAGAD